MAPPKSPKTAAGKPALVGTSDLPSLASGGPKLRHVCNQRPRRAKMNAVTRPTVGLTHDEDDEDVDAVDVFFSKSGAPASGNSGVVNGELEKG